MGLIREIVDEIIPLPKQSEWKFESDNLTTETGNLWYAIVNLFFQIVDCVLIPGITYAYLSGSLNSGWLNWIIIVTCGLSSIFSLGQMTYYFLFPVEKYVNPIMGRLLGETAIGAFIAALFRIPIYARIK